jgi:pimeloyl-ACP methyl ester carboxylesterase
MTQSPLLVMASTLLFGANRTAQERLAPTAKDASVFGYRIHYLEAGRGDPVILLHGTGGEGARWMPTIEGLASNFRIISLDQIGFGQSDKPLTTYHSGVFAGFLARFMKAIGVPRATIIGQSMGAGVALYLAVHNPEMVERPVLVRRRMPEVSARSPRRRCAGSRSQLSWCGERTIGSPRSPMPTN